MTQHRIHEAATLVRRAMQDDKAARGLDVCLLAAEWLAEHPVDDSDPVDAEWLLAVGFKWFGVTGWPSRHELAGDVNTLTIWSDGDTSIDCTGTGDGVQIPELKTRGGVRRLCACLGLPIGGKT